MQLAEYLRLNEISDEAFGKSIGVTRQAVHRYKTFDRFPEQSVLEEIFRETKGVVTPNDFLRSQVIPVTEQQGAA